MLKKIKIPKEDLILRNKAEQVLKERLSTVTKQFIDEHTTKLIYELDVYHTELEMQNEELRIAQKNAAHAAEKYIELYDNAPAGYFTLSKNGDIEEVNLFGTEMLGKTKKRLINNRFGLFISDDTRAIFNIFFEKIFYSKIKEYCEVALSVNNTLPIYVHITGIISTDGESCLITAADISQLKQSEQKSKQYAAALEVSNKELENFAYVASHDLQEPLRMVISFLKLLEKKTASLLNDAAKEYIHFAVDGAERMRVLINELLEYSKIGSNKDKFIKTDLNQLLKYVTSVLKNNIKQKKAIIKIQLLPVIVANKTLVNELFLNLINNALKFNNKPAPVIEVGYKDEKDKYVFYVKDNGIGINPHNFNKLFEMFQRLNGKTEYAGVGIGLALCKKIVEVHQGKIWLESEEGKGTTFYFSFPKNQLG